MQQETRKIASNEAVLASAPTEPDAFLLWSSQRRREEGRFELTWPKLPTELVGREGAIRLAGLGIELSMAAIFRGIPDAPAPA